MTFNSSKILFIAASVLLAAIFQFKPEWFIYHRAIMFTEPWRFLTAHWVHISWMHYLLNMCALGCLPFIFPNIKTTIFATMLVLFPVAISLLFYCFYPSLELYAGLSGVLHGMYLVAALLSWHDHKERTFSIIILAGLGIKLLWEANEGGLSATAQLIGGPILIQAHQMGIVVGLIFWGVLQLYRAIVRWSD